MARTAAPKPDPDSPLAKYCVTLRTKNWVRDLLMESAEDNTRSINTEIEHRLKQSLAADGYVFTE